MLLGDWLKVEVDKGNGIVFGCLSNSILLNKEISILHNFVITGARAGAVALWSIDASIKHSIFLASLGFNFLRDTGDRVMIARCLFSDDFISSFGYLDFLSASCCLICVWASKTRRSRLRISSELVVVDDILSHCVLMRFFNYIIRNGSIYNISLYE